LTYRTVPLEDAAVMKFFEASTHSLLATGSSKHDALSVVGAERLSESGYFRRKLLGRN